MGFLKSVKKTHGCSVYRFSLRSKIRIAQVKQPESVPTL